MAVALQIFALLVSLPSAVRAEEPLRREIEPAMAGSIAYDLAYLAAGGALYFTGRFALEPRDHHRAPYGQRGYEPWRPRADRASDVLGYGLLAVAPLTTFLLDARPRDGDRDRWVLALRTPIVVVESYVMAGALVAMLKNLGICRPYSWDATTKECLDGAGVPDGAVEQRRCFPSGHAASAGSIAGALLGLWLLPTDRDDRLAVPALGATLIGLTVGALRVRAGAHTIPDVTTGFLASATIGLTTAALHLRRAPRVDVAITGTGLSLSGRF